VQITGYLVQHKLANALAQIVGDTAWHGKEIRVSSGRRQRWDMVYEGPSGRVAVEFDGDEHYRNTLKIKNDREKDEMARCGGYRVVRIPYWVQLTSETLKHYFHLEAEIIQDFPHGFISTKVFPASFCELASIGLGLKSRAFRLQCAPLSSTRFVIVRKNMASRMWFLRSSLVCSTDYHSFQSVITASMNASPSRVDQQVLCPSRSR
jgi:hypothetical protein